MSGFLEHVHKHTSDVGVVRGSVAHHQVTRHVQRGAVHSAVPALCRAARGDARSKGELSCGQNHRLGF